MRTTLVALAAAAGLSVAGCQSAGQNTAIGAGLGGLLGAGVGALVDDGGAGGILLGAGIGALAGGAVGHYMDRQEEELRRGLSGTGVQVIRDGNNLVLVMPGNVTFDSGSTTIRQGFFPVLSDVAGVLGEYNQTIVNVIGHTDDQGEDDFNQGLSERRSIAVANYIGSRGIIPQRLYTRGLGESSPIASNDTPEGRQLNRRVELTLVPLT